MASHRVLAVNRGEAEGFLKVSLEVDAQQAENEVSRCMCGRAAPPRRWWRRPRGTLTAA